MVQSGDLWVIDFGDPYPSEPGLFRPALVVGPVPKLGPRFPNIFVVPFTSTFRGLDFHIEFEPTTINGLTDTSYAQCELLRSVSKIRLVNQIGVAELESTLAVDRMLRYFLGW
jgi:mRNA interferase MazF